MMVGELSVSFCQRKNGETSLLIDLWSYPDGTCNLVVALPVSSPGGEDVFPCAPSQLSAVLEGRVFSLTGAHGSIVIEKSVDRVCAQYTCLTTSRSVRHCLPVDDFRRAVDALAEGSIGYVA
ncbi:MAG: hypothetical protein P4L46_08920 [Fimbriimonas sp.]|nr:hypothetical protein [Fimbriimonas sp.]